MIVIGKLESIYKKKINIASLMESQNDDEMVFEDSDEQMFENVEVEACKIKISKLIAINQM